MNLLTPYFILILLLIAAVPARGWEGEKDLTLKTSTKNTSLIFSYPSFNSEIFDRQLEKYLRYIATFGPPDILIVGSSRAVQGVDPIALQQALVAAGYPKLKIFNFGINGGTARVVELQLRQLLTPEQLPRMIIWADGLRAFNSGRLDRTYRALITSPGYQRLIAGIRPQLNSTTTNNNEITTPLERIQPRPRPIKPLPSNYPNNPNIDPINFIPGVPTALRDYKTLKPDKKIKCNNINQLRKPITATRLWGEIICLSRNQQLPPAVAAKMSDREFSGFIVVNTRYNPNTYYQKFRRVAGEHDGDYTPFRLQGEQTNALRSVATFARDKKIPLMIVNLPLTKDYLDGIRSERERIFQEFMQQNARVYGFIFRDFSRKWLTNYDYFADPSHLNRFGAEAVAQQLAQDRTIPWPI